MSHITISSFSAKWIDKLDRIDFELIVAHFIGKERSFVIAHPDHMIASEAHSTLTLALNQRMSDMPLAYIIGKKEFFGRDFIVTKDTLIPRPETEFIITDIIHNKNTIPAKTLIVDVGTGSGAIIVTLAKELAVMKKNISFIGSDISHEALSIARKNSKIHFVDSYINFFHSDLLSYPQLHHALSYPQLTKIIFTANLPYVDETIKNELLQKKESRSLIHEPQIALWSSDHGLHHYRLLIDQIFLLKNKLPQTTCEIYCEISSEQKEIFFTLLASYHVAPARVTIINDLTNRPRIIHFTI